MTLNGKRDDFTVTDFRACVKTAMLKRGRDKAILEEVCEAVRRWPEFAEQADVPAAPRKQIGRAHRMSFAEA